MGGWIWVGGQKECQGSPPRLILVATETVSFIWWEPQGLLQKHCSRRGIPQTRCWAPWAVCTSWSVQYPWAVSYIKTHGWTFSPMGASLLAPFVRVGVDGGRKEERMNEFGACQW